ncbi:MAG: DUF721 domain-containing protein [Acidimicrobiales bacterium]
MRRRDDEPARLADVLNQVAGRLRKVDLRVIDEVRAIWGEVVDPALATTCRPEFVRSGTLVVSVPSGAYAERVRLDATTIVSALARLGEGAPTTLRTVLRDPS